MVAMKAMKAGARAMTGGDLTKKIAESTQLKNKEVKGVFAALRTIAYAEVKKTEKFVIPQLTTFKLQKECLNLKRRHRRGRSPRCKLEKLQEGRLDGYEKARRSSTHLARASGAKLESSST